MSEALVTVSENRFWGCIRPYANRDELIKEICQRLETGEPLAAICREEKMPSARHVAVWASQEPDVATSIAQSRALGEEAIALEALEIIDGLRPIAGMIPDAQRDKARAEMRLKLLAKFNPKRWGDSTQLKHADANGDKLDNSSLVNQLLSLMPGSAQPPIEGKARNVTPTASAQPAKSPYRPRIPPSAADVDDLV